MVENDNPFITDVFTSYEENTDKVIIYASKKGTAESVAKNFSDQMNIKCVDCRDIDVSDLKKYSFILFVVANYGRGEAPPNSLDFWNKFFEITDEKFLDGVDFAIFGCGASKRAPFYQVFTKNVEKHLINIGAKEVCDMGCRDACAGDNTSVEAYPQLIRNSYAKVRKKAYIYGSL